MKTLQKVMMAALLLLGFLPRVQAAEIFKNDDLDLSFGGRIQLMGAAELVTADPVRDHFRLFLWNESDRLFTTGDYKGYKWNFEVEFGGETPANGTNGSNGVLNLYDANVDIPLIPDMVTAKIGQFKMPGNLESAVYEGSMLFTEKSPLYNLFFNQGYDCGVALYGHIGNLDGQAGLVQGAPDLPQRYLPEILNFPTPLFLRIGYNDGITDNPFKPAETGFDKPTKTEFAIHLNGYYSADQNAGHSNDLGLGGGYLATFNANNNLYGNVLNSSIFNPYLGAAGASPVTANYWQAGMDFQLRTPLNDTTFTLTGMAMIEHYDMTVPQAMAYETQTTTLAGQAVLPGQQYALNVGGGMIEASVGDNPWEFAGRFAMAIPDTSMVGAYANRKLNGSAATPATGYAPIFTDSTPIYELTIPSITWHMNADCKLVAETMFMINTPAVPSDDGTYLVTEMPGSATSGVNGGNFRIGLVPMGRMQFQLMF